MRWREFYAFVAFALVFATLFVAGFLAGVAFVLCAVLVVCVLWASFAWLWAITETFLRSFDFWLNFTTPSISAKIVWSLPMPTLSPAWILVPRWRTMILPARTNCEPNFLIPSRRPAESRLFWVLPCPFLCAILSSPLYEVWLRLVF